MIKKSATLPRHTNLASIGARFIAFVVDLAIASAITIMVYSFISKPIINKLKVNELQERFEEEQLKSHLKYLNEDGKIVIHASSDSWTSYRDDIAYYYLTYLTGYDYLTGNKMDESLVSKNYNQPITIDSGAKIERKDYYTVSWFNKNILNITNDPDGDKSVSIFTYDKTGESYDYTKLGVARIGQKYYDKENDEDLTITEQTISVFMQSALQTAYYDFETQDFVLAIENPLNFYLTLALVIGLVVGFIISYVVMPFIFKNGQTIGKKINKIGLASIDGYKFENKNLLMRVMPSIIVILALLIPAEISLFAVIIVILTLFLVSFALAMASSKKCALHDFVARSIVIDLKTSIIFENEIIEEEYLLKEDNIVPEKTYGKEPELKYEK